MNFPGLWRKWIRSCLAPARTSILVNGSPKKEFNVNWGLRQGDPLYSFLFILVMEALSITVDTAKQVGLFTGVKLPNNGPHLPHLFYADDALFLGAN